MRSRRRRWVVTCLALEGALGCGARSGLVPASGDDNLDGGTGETTTSSTSSTSSTTTTTSTVPTCEAVSCDASWVRSFAPGPDGGGWVYSTAADACGRAAVAFGSSGLSLGGTTPSGIAVAQFDAAGAPRWVADLSTTSLDGPVLASGPDGTLAVGGVANATFLFDGVSAANAGLADGVLLVIDPDGAARWARGLGTSSDHEEVTAVATDASGRVFVAGVQQGGIDAGGGPLPGRAFVAAFSGSGEPLWSHGFGTAATAPRSLATSPSGDLFMTGDFVDAMSVAGGPTLATTGDPAQPDMFLVRLRADGAHVFSKRYGDEQTQRGLAVAVGDDDTIVVAGMVTGSIDFGAGSLSPGSGPFDTGSFVAHLTSDATALSSALVGDAPTNLTQSLTAGVDGRARLSLMLDPSRLLTIDGSGDVTSSSITPTAPPFLGKMPGGTFAAQFTTQPVDLGTGPIDAPSLYLARLCDSL